MRNMLFLNPRKPFPWIAVLILFFAGLFGMAHINASSVNIDELLAFGDMGGFAPYPYTPVQIVGSLVEHHPDHVPLWFIFGATMAQLTGWSQAALRTVTVLTSLLMLAVMYRFAKEHIGRKTALIALFMISTTEVILHHTYKIRMSPLLMLLGILHCWTYFRLANDKQSLLTWLAFVVTGTAILYTHFFGILLLIGMGVNHLFYVTRSRLWGKLIAAWLVTGFLFLPYLPVLFQGFNYNLKNSATLNVFNVLVWIFQDLVNNGLVLWVPLLLALFLTLRRYPNAFVRAILRIGLIGCAAYLLAKLVLDETLVTRIRYLFVLWFALLIPLAFGLASAPRWYSSLFLVAWCAFFYADMRPKQVPCMNSDSCISRPFALRSLRDIPYPKDVFISAFDQFDTTDRSTRLRAHGYSMVDFYLRELGYDSVALRLRRSLSYFESKYEWLKNKHLRFLLGYNPTKVPPHFSYLLDLIADDYLVCELLIDEPTMSVQSYVDRSLGCEHKPHPVAYTNSIKVLDRWATYLPEQERLQILTWIETADQLQPFVFNVSWQIISSDWQNVRQVDRHLHDSTVLPWSRIDISTEGLAPGDYRLMLIVYRNDTGAKISFLDPETDQLSSFLPILAFNVEGDIDSDG